MNKTEQALKPCPFCGCKATFVKHSAGIPGTQGFDSWDAVACKHCRATVGACDRRFRCRDDAGDAWNRRLPSQSEAPAEQPAPGVNPVAQGVSSGGNGRTEGDPERFEAWWNQCLERGYLPKPLDILQAAKRDALTQAPQERAAVTDEWIISAVSAAKIHFVHEGAATTLAIGHAVANALLSLAQSSEGEKLCGS